MRTNSEIYNEFNQASLKELRLVVVIHFSSPLYLTSHSGIPNIPADNLEDVLRDVSSTSQRLVPDEGRSEIGSMSFSVVDVDGAVTTRFRTEQENGSGLRGRKVELYRGGAGMDWSDFRLEQTQQIDADVTWNKRGYYEISCADIQRQMRQDICDLAKTRLAATLAKGGTTLTVADTSAFEACTHVASFQDQATGSYYYLKIKYNNGFEIVRATGKTSTTFTGLTRGLFGTDDVEHTLPTGSDEDAGVEIEEYVYLELPAPAMAYALLTGDIIGGGTIPWHLGIDTALVDQDSFENIGEDWFDSSDYTKGLIFRFQGLEKTDGKRFIEREVCLLAGAFLRVGADGKLYMRRMTGVIGEADYVAEINPDNAITHGSIKHDLSKVRNTFDIEWSWVHIPGESKARFLRRNILVDATSIAMHGEGKALALQFKGLHADRHTFTTLRNRFDALRDRYSGPPIIFPADLLPSMNDLEVGDIVRARFPNVRDFSGTGTLDRSCEIERITINQRTGRVQAELFASTRKADPIADDGAGTDSELPDGWYDSFGTAMSSLLTIDGSGLLTVDGTLTGGTTTRTAYYYLGDFTIPAGRTLELTGNVQLHIRGHYQNNGTLLVTGGQAADTGGFLGSTFGGRAITIRDGQIHEIPGPRVVGAHQVMPAIEIENHAGTLAGIPNDMRGSGGAAGGNVWNWTGSAMVSVAAGGAGGAGGGSVVIVSRGAGYGVAGQTVLSGEDGSAGTSYDPGGSLDIQRSGSGGGGAPGCLLHVLDGSQVTVPVLAGFVVAKYGTSPITQGVAETQGKARADDPVDLGIAAARIVYVPKSREPYPDFENDNLSGASGKSVFAASVYRRSATPPAMPAADDGSYNFTTRALTPPTGWSATPPASDGNPLYVSLGIFEIVGTSGTDETVSWSAPAVLVSDGADGDPGTPGDDGNSSIVVSVYQRSATTPATPTADDGSYNFTTRNLIPPTGWSATPPATDGNPLWASVGIFEVAGTSGTDETVTWTAPTKLVSDGSKVEYVFKRSAVQPATPTGDNIPTGWSDDPVGGSDPLWVSKATQTATGVTQGSWSTPVRMDSAGGSAALNVGRRMDSLFEWFGNHDQSTPLDAQWSAVELTGPVRNTAFRVQDNDDTSRGLVSERMTIDPTKRYRVSVWARQPSGDRKNYLLVAFYDDAGNHISGIVSDAAGPWSKGTYHYYLANSVLTTDWTLYSIEFGGSAAATIPTGAAALAIGGLFVRDGAVGTATTVELQDLHVIQVPEDGAQGDPGTPGTPGDDAITGFLTHESHVVSASADGTGYSLTGAGGTFKVFDGINDVTGSGPTYSVQGTATKNGLTMSINSTSGVYSLSGASWTSDTETFTLRAAYGGVNVDKVYTIAKSKQGPSPDGFVDLPAFVQDSSTGTLPQSAQLVWTTDGFIKDADGNTLAKWWSNAPETGIGSSYQVRLEDTIAGTFETLAAAEGTWITISADRTYGVLRTFMDGTGTDVADGSFQIRAVGETTILDECLGSVDAGDV